MISGEIERHSTSNVRFGSLRRGLETLACMPARGKEEMASPHYSGSTAGGVDSDQLLVEANGSTRTLILNRPKQLNALSSTMIKELLRCFIAYQKDDGVKLLIMKGKGRAFCAGGDAAVGSQAVLDGNYITALISLSQRCPILLKADLVA